MTAGEALYAICVADTGVRALIGDGASPPNIRLYPAGNIPQSNGAASEILPAATYQTIGGAPANTFHPHAPADNERIQLDCWSTDYDQAQSVADALRAAIENEDAQVAQSVGIQIVSFNGRDYEPETKRYRVSFDISVWLSR